MQNYSADELKAALPLLEKRMDALRVDARPLFGKMNVLQMLRHLR